MADLDISFSFIQEVGKKVNEILINDPNKADWVNDTINYYNENDEYPENLVIEIINYLTDTGDEEKENLLDQIKKIVLDEDNVENLLGAIFFPSLGEEEEEEGKEEDDEPPIIEDEEPQQVDEATLDPDAYFEYNINKLATTLSTSRDVAYVLLNYFFWNKTQIEKNYFQKQDEILKNLRIKVGSKLVPNLKSPLSVKLAGKGTCSFCLDEDVDLYEIYCGHALCKQCLVDDIKQQILENKPPSCRQQCEDGSLCNAEIMQKDVQKLIDNEFFKKYRILIRNYIISRNNEIRECPNPFCGWLITPANRLPCHVGRCYRCNSVTCLMGKHDAHAPLIKCEQIDEFTIEIAEEMRQLEQDQRSWFAREERLKDYRRSHVSEVQNVFNKSIQDLKKKQSEEEYKEKKRISDLDKQIDKYQNEISNLRRTLNQYLDNRKPKEDVDIIMSQVQDISDECNKVSELKRLYLLDMKMNQLERSKNLTTAQQESSFFISALSSQYQFYMNKFKESQEIRAYQGVSVSGNDDDYIKRITKKCPKCHSPIQRADGCNYMACNLCKFEFCWLCEQPWHPTHRDHFQCPKLQESLKGQSSKKSSCGIDFNDLNDKKFYPQPMSLEKRADFIRYNNLSNKFKEQREKYNKMYKDLMDTENQADISKGIDDIPDYKLCKKIRLERAMRKNFNKADSEINAMKVINTVLYAQSVVMWSYPALYYMARNPHKAQVFEYKISELAKNLDALNSKISDASSYTGIDFIRFYEALQKEIEMDTDEADIF